jgi:hypothetical protein
MNQIRDIYGSNRGPELGTVGIRLAPKRVTKLIVCTQFGGTILSTIFEHQSEKWAPLALSHTSKAISVVHNFVYRLLTYFCPEQHVRDWLWDSLLVDRLTSMYREAMDHTRFLLQSGARAGPAPSIIISTFNHDFNATLLKKRAERLAKPLKDNAAYFKGHKEPYVRVKDISRCAVDKSNAEQVCEDILDTPTSYYNFTSRRALAELVI